MKKRNKMDGVRLYMCFSGVTSGHLYEALALAKHKPGLLGMAVASEAVLLMGSGPNCQP